MWITNGGFADVVIVFAKVEGELFTALGREQILRDAIETLGGDPTVVTPSADVVGVAGSGWVQALTDPRTTLTEALKVVLAAELADNDGWETLVEVAAGLEQEELAAQFREAASDE